MSVSSCIAVILNYCRAKDTIECLASINQSTVVPDEIIVVDNNSPDNSREIISKAYPQVTLINSGDNLGYTGGMNVVIKCALKKKTTYLLVMNSDTILERCSIALLIDALQKSPQSAVATGTIYHRNTPSRIWYAGGSINYWRASAFVRNKMPVRRTSQFVSFISGCAFIVRSSIIEKIGMFDERFFMYAEDTEFSARIQSNGYKLLYVPNAHIYHRVGREDVHAMPLYYNVRNRYLFLKLCSLGLDRFLGYTYLSIVLILKILWWLFRDPCLAIAAIQGVEDYFRNNFYSGRGIALQTKNNP
jgi:GT2 family glycosyltransferase